MSSLFHHLLCLWKSRLLSAAFLFESKVSRKRQGHCAEYRDELRGQQGGTRGDPLFIHLGFKGFFCGETYAALPTHKTHAQSA